MSRRGAQESRAVTVLFEGPRCTEHVLMTDGPPPERRRFGNHDGLASVLVPEWSSASENAGPIASQRATRTL